MSMDLLIHIGEVSGGYIGMRPQEVWRVNPDGALRDTYRKLTCVFEMEERAFFERYADTASAGRQGYLDACREGTKSHLGESAEKRLAVLERMDSP